MTDRKGSPFWRMAGIGMLALSALPLLWTGWTNRQAESRTMAAAPGEVWDVPGELVVQFKDGVDQPAWSSFMQDFGLSFAAGFQPSPMVMEEGRIFDFAVQPQLAPSILAKVRRDPRVELAEPQHLF